MVDVVCWKIITIFFCHNLCHGWVYSDCLGVLLCTKLHAWKVALKSSSEVGVFCLNLVASSF